ncbi:hypothetical protein [Clostridium perfringens]|nr:hypothetical protein [Clostridium perfringens]
MTKETQIKMLQERLSLLKSRKRDNKGVIRKLERKIRNLSG